MKIMGRQRYAIPMENPQYTNKTQEDFTSEIETRSGVTLPPWPPNHNDIMYLLVINV